MENPLPFPPLTPEEIRTLRECNKQAFYQRSLPFSAGAMLGMGLAIRSGYVTKQYIWFKLLFPGLAGFVLGKVSYIGKCKEMLMHIPGSPLGEKLKKLNNPSGYQEMMREMAVFPTIPGTAPTTNYDTGKPNQRTRPVESPFNNIGNDREASSKMSSFPDTSSTPRYDLESARYDATYKGLMEDNEKKVDRYDPTSSSITPSSLYPKRFNEPLNQSSKPSLSAPPQSQTSYDDLRYRNRFGSTTAATSSKSDFDRSYSNVPSGNIK